MTEQLRALLVSGEYPPMEGGVADFTHILGGMLAEKGVTVHVLTSQKAQSETHLSGKVHCHPVLSSWKWGALYGALRRLRREINPDVLNIQYQTAAYGMHPAINFLPLVFRDVPCITTFHDLLVPYLFPKAGRLRWQANLVLARASRAVIVTNAQDRARLSAYPWLQRLDTIPIGSNIACQLPAAYDRENWRKHLGIPAASFLLCYFGFLNASKGGEELITAMDMLRSSGYNVALLMIGGALGASDPTNHAYLQAVQHAIGTRGLAERIVWTGYLPPEEVSASMCCADLCVLPYRDGVSFRRGSFMAALAHGLPILSTQPEVALPELVDGSNIMLVPPRDPSALAAAIVRLAQDPTLRQSLGAGARELAQEFDWQRIATRTLEVYHAVTARPGPAGSPWR
jgi:glycosyltransferase involved in cell wall biosynthesis